MRKNGNVVLDRADATSWRRRRSWRSRRTQPSPTWSRCAPSRSRCSTTRRRQDLAKLLSTNGQKILSKRGSATVDERTNTLFVQDTSSRLEEVRKMILQIDVPVRQVMIEARIVIADDKWGRQLGARFGTQSAFSSNNYNFGVSGNLTDTNSPLSDNPVSRGSASRTLSGRRHVDRRVLGRHRCHGHDPDRRRARAAQREPAGGGRGRRPSP